MKKEAKGQIGRRDVLRALGAGAGLAATAAAPLATGAAAAESADERTKARYKESDHVKSFYRVNRYPAK
jgi:H+/Cl- antiporter ClcA